MTKPRTIVLLSGGMNSAVCLLANIKAVQVADIIECMIFDHGQRHAEEVDYARSMCDRLKVPSSIWYLETKPLMDVGIYAMPDDLPLTEKVEVIYKAHFYSQIINNAFYRAHEQGAAQVVAGFIDAEVPFSFDEANGFWAATRKMMGLLAPAPPPELYLPFFFKSKIELFHFAESCDVLGEVLRDTISCMNGNTELQHEWGYGCGSCGGCVRRWRAWEEYQHRKS